mmetsp:Transcript_24895/g.25520  ORF Transcript_24895/g.25520 Transcript_24895/m.25520 type:complete len:191 (+) Transcript_24895:34-606(+)
MYRVISRRFSTFQSQYKILSDSAYTVLLQQQHILKTISDEDYIKHHQFYLGSSVGGHIRHSLDHWSKLLNHDFTLGCDEEIDYDSRERFSEIETNRLVALDTNERLQHSLSSALQTRDPNMLVKVMFIGDSKSGVKYSVNSTFGRELSFIAHHSTHHLSTIKLLMQSMSYELPQNVGMANSTIHYWDQKS